MIKFDPFFDTIKRKNISTYKLRHKHNISSATIHRMSKNLPISTTTIDDLCTILNCRIDEIAIFVPAELLEIEADTSDTVKLDLE